MCDDFSVLFTFLFAPPYVQALRLDWFRLQALTSVSRAALSLRDKENADLAPAMNAVVVHSKLVDNFEELLIEQADMSFFWYIAVVFSILIVSVHCFSVHPAASSIVSLRMSLIVVSKTSLKYALRLDSQLCVQSSCIALVHSALKR